MVKVIAFDLVGVLVKENDYVLSELESKIERLFGPNSSDEEFLDIVKKNICDDKDENILNTTYGIINNIYDCKIDLARLREFKTKYPNIKLVVATNHISLIEKFILDIFSTLFDNIYISANMNATKPNIKFYNKILESEKINSDEMLFLDDSIKNIEGAKACGIHIIHVTRKMDILDEIEKYINNK